MKSQYCFMAVQVVSRLEDGRLADHYKQEMRATLKEARADAVRLSREFPGTPYQVVRITLDEIGDEKLWTRGLDEVRITA